MKPTLVVAAGDMVEAVSEEVVAAVATEEAAAVNGARLDPIAG
jgi:hypothetical protein